MKYSKTLPVLVAGLVFSAAVLASAQNDTETSTGMPKMNHGAEMMEHHQNMHMMNHQAMHQMMHMGNNHGNAMMGHGTGDKMDPKMMQKRMEHMQKMEQHMARMESLLEQILEAQKANQ